MIDSWMDRSFGWLTSIGLHVALLLGLTLVVVEQYVHASGRVGGVRCAIIERGPAIDRIDHLSDQCGAWAAKPDPPPFLDDFLSERSRLAFLSSWSADDRQHSPQSLGIACPAEDIPTPTISEISSHGIPRYEPDRYRPISCRCKVTLCRLGTRCPVCHGLY